MSPPGRRVHLARHRSTGIGWELAAAEPHPRLQRHVLGYQGYLETGSAPVRRREMPGGRVVLILNLGPPVRVAENATGPTDWREQPRSFLAGMYDRSTLVETHGMEGMQVDFSPIGAHLLFGLPMRELTNRVVPLEDLLGSAGRRLEERVAETKGWENRFAILDSEIARRLPERGSASPEIEWAWRQLRAARWRSGPSSPSWAGVPSV